MGEEVKKPKIGDRRTVWLDRLAPYDWSHDFTYAFLGGGNPDGDDIPEIYLNGKYEGLKDQMVTIERDAETNFSNRWRIVDE